MKHKLLSFILILSFLTMGAVAMAQSPKAVTMQSVLRDASGRLVSNQLVSVRITLRSGSASGTVVYSETHAPITNQNGLYTVFFGQGTPVSGSFSAINWGNGPYFANVEADPTGGSNYSLSVSHQIVTVPYTFFADSSMHYRENQTLSISNDTIFLSGGVDNPTGGSRVKLPNDSVVRALQHIVDSLVNNNCFATVRQMTATACDRYTWTVDQNTYTASGVYNKVFPRANSQGCDSIVMLDLTIKRSTNIVSNVTASVYYMWHDVRYTASGTYYKAYTNGQGCPSNDTLYLKITPVGTLPGLFSVSATKKVRFSSGNLQFRGNPRTWRFAQHQYDRISSAEYNLNPTATHTGWEDLFGFGTSGYSADGGNTRYAPNSTGTSTLSGLNYYGYGPSSDNTYGLHLTGGNARSDWGFNAISNGGNVEGLWRTLTDDEWTYLLRTRPSPRYAHASVCGVNGLLIFPDGYVHPTDNSIVPALYRPDQTGANALFANNSYDAQSWAWLERLGVVFLPVTGYRTGANAVSNTTYGYYWSSTAYANGYGTSSKDASRHAKCIYFYDAVNITTSSSQYRYYGMAVRLVQNVTN